MKRLRLLAVGLFVAVAIHSWQPVSSHGVTIISWDQPSGGMYSSSFNWDPSNVPNTVDESAQFSIDESYDVTFSTDRTVSDLLVLGSNVSFSTNNSATADVTYTVDDDVSIGGSTATLTLTEIVNAFNVNLAVSDEIRIGTGQLNIRSGSQVSNIARGVIGNVGGNFGTATVTGTGSTWTNSSDLVVGNIGQGTLNINAGGQVSNIARGVIGNSYTADLFTGTDIGVGTVTVTGTGSTWTNSNDLVVGNFGIGALNIEAGGQVSNIATGVIGNSYAFTITGSIRGVGTATVTGPGSTWTNSNDLIVGNFGTGTLNIEAGGQVSNSSTGTLGYGSGGSSGTATVTGPGSTWTNSNDLVVGNLGIGTLNINDSGLVTVGTTTSINASSSVVLNGGRFEFGTLDLASYARISGTSGELAGDLPLSGFNALSASVLSILNIDVSEVRILNSGVLFGTGVVGQALVNSSTSELRTLAGEWARFGGVSNTNAGEVNNFGGVVEFEQDFTNEATGFVGGRGQFIANGGWTNEGAMAFSGGFADVLGDVTNTATGQVSVGGTSVATFFDDVTMDAGNLNIDVAASGVAVFLGSYNGGNDGTGAVEILGDLRPGNSPAEVSFGGDLTLGAAADTFFELSSTTTGLFDRLVVAGTATLAGTLDVQLLGGFTPSAGDSFEILNAGSLLGNFSAVNLPALPGDLLWFINQTATTLELVSTYGADFDENGAVDDNDLFAWESGFGSAPAVHMTGDANSSATANGFDFLTWQRQFGNGGGAPALAAATATPEPSSLLLAAVAVGGLTLHRRRSPVVSFGTTKSRHDRGARGRRFQADLPGNGRPPGDVGFGLRGLSR